MCFLRGTRSHVAKAPPFVAVLGRHRRRARQRASLIADAGRGLSAACPLPVRCRSTALCTVRCLSTACPLPVHCLSLTSHCLSSLTSHCPSLASHCLSLTSHCHRSTSLGPKPSTKTPTPVPPPRASQPSPPPPAATALPTSEGASRSVFRREACVLRSTTFTRRSLAIALAWNPSPFPLPSASHDLAGAAPPPPSNLITPALPHFGTHNNRKGKWTL